jgi:hypothetical protein
LESDGERVRRAFVLEEALAIEKYQNLVNLRLHNVKNPKSSSNSSRPSSVSGGSAPLGLESRSWTNRTKINLWRLTKMCNALFRGVRDQSWNLERVFVFWNIQPWSVENLENFCDFATTTTDDILETKFEIYGKHFSSGSRIKPLLALENLHLNDLRCRCNRLLNTEIEKYTRSPAKYRNPNVVHKIFVLLFRL